MMSKKILLFLFAFLFILTAVSATEKVVLFAMDDFQTWWLSDIQDDIVQTHVDNQIPVTLGVIPSGITEDWGEGERFSQRMQEWDSYPNVEVAQHGYDHKLYFGDESYSIQNYQITLGNELMKGIGINPKSFIPPFGSANSNTVDVLIKLGFNTLYNPVEMISKSNDDLLIIQDQILLCRDGDEGKNCVYKNYDSVKQEIDSKLNEYGVALVLYHMQDFNKGTDKVPVFDTSKVNTLVTLADRLKQEGYILMTVEQYYQYKNSGEIPEELEEETPEIVDNDNDGYELNVDCNDDDPAINPGMSDNNCDGIDNNCNNQIDEDYLSVQISCGIGECANTIISRCNLGVIDNFCTPKSPSAEICDNFKDDDCDGKIDLEDSDCEIEIPEPLCGNGIVEAGEQCDDGNENGIICSASYGTYCVYCSSGCQDFASIGPYCGDGEQNGNEQCDDGNRINGDGCSSLCRTETQRTSWRGWWYRRWY